MAVNFKWSAEAPTAQPAKTKTGKPRGHNPPGARTRNEPKRVIYKNLPLPVHRPAGRTKEDTPELRAKLADAALTLVLTHDAYMDALQAFGDLGPLPLSIVEDMPKNLRLHLRNYRARKGTK
jgi:hypothetical protein